MDLDHMMGKRAGAYPGANLMWDRPNTLGGDINLLKCIN